jgi:hypothetical protein
MRKKKKEEDPTCPTMPIQAAGWKYFGLGRNASYEAAKRGEIPTVKIGGRLRALVAVLDKMVGRAA